MPEILFQDIPWMTVSVLIQHDFFRVLLFQVSALAVASTPFTKYSSRKNSHDKNFGSDSTTGVVKGPRPLVDVSVSLIAFTTLIMSHAYI